MKSSAIKKIILTLIIAYLLVLIGIYSMQRSLVFAPNSTDFIQKKDGIKEVILKTEQDRALYNWYAKSADSNIVVLFMHGNAGNISYRISKLERLSALGYDVFLLGYPGYGKSEGSPSEKGLVKAAKRGYEYLIGSGYSPHKIVLYGESLGTAVAVQLAASVDAKALILEAPMASVLEIASNQYPYLPVKYLLKDSFLSIDYIQLLSAPLLIIHGDQDKSIPIASGKRLYKAARSKKYFHTVIGGGHNNLYDFGIEELIQQFIENGEIP